MPFETTEFSSFLAVKIDESNVGEERGYLPLDQGRNTSHRWLFFYASGVEEDEDPKDSKDIEISLKPADPGFDRVVAHLNDIEATASTEAGVFYGRNRRQSEPRHQVYGCLLSIDPRNSRVPSDMIAREEIKRDKGVIHPMNSTLISRSAAFKQWFVYNGGNNAIRITSRANESGGVFSFADEGIVIPAHTIKAYAKEPSAQANPPDQQRLYVDSFDAGAVVVRVIAAADTTQIAKR